MAVGAASVLSPAYISEVAPANIRGRLTTVQQIMIITGLTAAFVVNYFLAKSAGVSTAAFWGGIEAWRWMFLMQALPAAIFLVALFLIPESPRYLVSKGRDEQAPSVLTSLFGGDVARAKLDEIRATFSADHRPRLRATLDGGRGWLGIRQIVWVGIMLAAFQQFVGINVIFYYGATLWQLAGFTESQSLADQHRLRRGFDRRLLRHHRGDRQDRPQAAAADRLGRHGGDPVRDGLCLQPRLARSRRAISSCRKDLGTLAVVAANLYVIFFNVSWGPVMWVMLGEMFPNQIRGSALAVSGFVQWFANFLISFSFPVMAAKLGLTISYTFYGVCAVISFFLVKAMVHETRGKELEQMEG